jgi:Spy/CpxP family protein refolding chaperone
MVTKRKGYLLLGAVFLLGSIAGGAGAYAFAQKQHAAILRDEPQKFDVRRLASLDRKLDLDVDQEARIRTILAQDRDDSRALSKDMVERCGQPLRDQKARVDAEIRDVLRPDQRARFDKLTDERRRRVRVDGGTGK